MTVIEKVLTILEDYDLSFYKTLANTYTISSIAQTTPTSVRVTFTSNISASVGQYLYIDSGVSNGFHLITNVSTNYVDFTDTITGLPQSFGTGKIYSIKDVVLNDFIEQQKAYIKKITGLKFDGVETFTEYHDGSGRSELMLDRRPVNSVSAIQFLTIPVEIAVLPVSAVQVLPELGLLRIKRINVETYSTIYPVFPIGHNNVKIIYEAGFTELPDNVASAISNFVTADMLQREASLSGGGVSISVVSYSKSFAPNGKYGEAINTFRRKALQLLKPYMSGVVGQ